MRALSTRKLNNLTVLVWAALTKCNSLWWLTQQTFFFFFTVLEAGISKIRMPASLCSSESSLPGLQVDTFLLYPHMAGRVSSYKSTSLIHKRTTSWPSPGSQLQITSYYGIELQIMNFKWHKHSIHSIFQSPRTKKWQSQDSNPGSLVLKFLMLLTSILCLPLKWPDNYFD